jgi:hypothetical protein
MHSASRVFRRGLLGVLVALLFLLGGCSNTATVGKVSITDRFNTLNVAALKLGSATATCNAGEQMVSGGYGVTTTAYSNTIDAVHYPIDQYPIVASYPSSPTSWTATLLNRVQGATLLVVHAECVSTSVGVQIASALGNIDTNAVTATCPQGSQRTGGGWQVTNVNQTKEVVTIQSSLPSGTNGWSVKARPARGSTASTQSNQIKSFVVCAANTLTTSTGASSAVTAPPGLPNIVTPGPGHASCGSNQLLVGAGFSVSDIDGNLPVELFFPSYDVSPAQWAISMVSLPDSSIEGQALNSGGTGSIVPICASVAS